MITRINESKSLVKHISSDCRCTIDGKNVIQSKSKNGIVINVDVNPKNIKAIYTQRKLYMES